MYSLPLRYLSQSICLSSSTFHVSLREKERERESLLVSLLTCIACNQGVYSPMEKNEKKYMDHSANTRVNFRLFFLHINQNYEKSATPAVDSCHLGYRKSISDLVPH